MDDAQKGEYSALRDSESRLLGRLVPGGGYYKPRTLSKGTYSRRVLVTDEADEPFSRTIQVPCLQWQWKPPLRECLKLVKGEFTGGVLDGFVALHSQSDDQILDYARKHGVLGLCACERPFGHSRPQFNRPSLFPGRMCQPLGREPFDVWRKYSREAALTLRMAQLSYAGPPDWNVANDKLEREWRKWTQLANLAVEREGTTRKNTARKNFFSRQAQAGASGWIKQSSTGLFCIRKSATELTIGMECQTLFDVLAIQLLMAVLRADRLSACAECGTAIVRSLKKGERRIYCDDPSCKKKGKNRIAQSRMRADERKAKQAFRKGKDLETVHAHMTRRSRAKLKQWLNESKAQK